MPRNPTRRARPRAGEHEYTANAAFSANRRRLAEAAARIMAEQQMADFEPARRKAAARAGITDRRCWPSNEEIQSALLEWRRLFVPAAANELRQVRQQAREAMRLCARFRPRLVGPARDGTATREQGARIQLFADSPEEVIWLLIDQGIPWRDGEERFRYADGTWLVHPALSFMAGEVPIRLLILPSRDRRDPPLGALSNRPERGASLVELERLLAAEAELATQDQRFEMGT